MTSENGLPAFVRFKGLYEHGIVDSYQGLRHLIKNESFPPGRRLGPSSRIWSVDEVNAWLNSRPTEPSAQTRARAKKSTKARAASEGW
jgi:hypothetical protein